MELYIYHKIKNWGPWGKTRKSYKTKIKETWKKGPLAGGRSKIQSFTDVSVGKHRLHLSSAFVERQQVTNCPILCRDQLQRPIDSSH